MAEVEESNQNYNSDNICSAKEESPMRNLPRDLLRRFMGVKKNEKLGVGVGVGVGVEEEMELSLGLSMNGRFGVDPTAKKIKRTTSIPELGREEGTGNLVRTCSLPTETEEEWRKRKELQTLRRMEARRKRSEKQRNLKKALREQQQRLASASQLVDQAYAEPVPLGRTLSLTSRVSRLALHGAENVLIQSSGHVSLTDFDLSCLTSSKPQLIIPATNSTKKKKKKQQKSQEVPMFMAEPMRASNSFVGTEEYIAPEIITGSGHTSAVDWWALGILIFEMLYGYTPFRGKTRQKTFANILHKDLKFPKSKPVSLQGKQLIYWLLQRDPKDRLGSREGANEIKRHPFFRGVNWALVRWMKPPELDAPLLPETEEEKEAKNIDTGLEDLQTNVF